MKDCALFKKTSDNRRNFLKTAVATSAGLASLAGGRAWAANVKRPNILFLLVDQWRSPRWFPADAELPAFDRLRREGVSFNNFFVSCVPCSASRATLLTGLHLNQHGITSNLNHEHLCPSLDPSIPTVGHVFQKAGYKTPYLGKWHLTTSEGYRKSGLTPYGFEEWYPPDRHGSPLEGLMYDKSFADRTIEWLEQNGQAGPWFLTCSLINPHDICFYPRLDVPPALIPNAHEKLPENWNDDLSAKPRIQSIYRDGYGLLLGSKPPKPERFWLHYLDFYYYLTRKVDLQMQRVLSALDRLGLADDTIVIFTSDHGDMCGSHMLPAKGPFVYQENNNVPFVVRWPSRIPAGVQTDALSQSPDFLPTMLELAGIENRLDYLPGRSIAPELFNPENKGLNDLVLMGFEYGRESNFIKLGNHVGLSPDKAPLTIRAVFDGRYKYARYYDDGLEDEYELYDLVNDPGELHNLAGDPGYRSRQKEMADKLREAQARQMSPRLLTT